MKNLNMESETSTSSSSPPLESRKIRKPLMEKKRRARINDSLETLKKILLDSKTLFKEGASKKGGHRTAKLEKADILEMTVLYIQHLHQKIRNIPNQKQLTNEYIQSTDESSSDENEDTGLTLIPRRLKTGQIVYVAPRAHQIKTRDENNNIKFEDRVWRPW